MPRRDWSPEQARGALEWYAALNGMDVWRDVVVSEGGWRGWCADAERHVLEGVAVVGEGSVCAWDEEQFARAACESVVRPIAPWGVAHRPVLGLLVACSAMLARSYPGHGPIQPLALVGRSEAHPNTAATFHAYGIEIIAVPDEVVR